MEQSKTKKLTKESIVRMCRIGLKELEKLCGNYEINNPNEEIRDEYEQFRYDYSNLSHSMLFMELFGIAFGGAIDELFNDKEEK